MIYKDSFEVWFKWRDKIEGKDITQEEIKLMLQDLAFIDPVEKIFGGFFNKIIMILKNIKPQLAEYFNCKEDQILINYSYSKTGEKNKDAKIILGNANFTGLYDPKDVYPNLEKIYGNADFENVFAKFPNLKRIYGNANFQRNQQNFDNLEVIGGRADLRNCSSSFKNLKYILEAVDLDHSHLTDFGKIRFTGKTFLLFVKNNRLRRKISKEFEFDKTRNRSYRKPQYLNQDEKGM